ncbi:hypothetical protein EPN95_00885 [Patescibacteria group bacterium]|nr:MAG: hypothetical protein EPN95_00885 [Patescibacteria group bacterium]
MIKKILISAGIIVAIAGVTLAVLYFIKQAQPAPAKTSSAKTLVLDHSKDYGACTLLGATLIKSTLGDTANKLQPSTNTGITKDKYFGSGVSNVVSDSQACIYAFVPGGNAGNGFNATNAFMITRTVFTNTGGPVALIAQMKQNTTLTSIDSLGDAAFYSADATAQGPGATHTFNLQVFTGTKETSYTINQPTASATFTADTAKTALTALAQTVKS